MRLMGAQKAGYVDLPARPDLANLSTRAANGLEEQYKNMQLLRSHGSKYVGLGA